MKIIDLSQEMYSGMPVFPWDPEVKIETICSVENDWWEMRRVEINSHDATHVNVPCHGKIWWKNLDDYHLEDFMGESVLFDTLEDIFPWMGIIFGDKKDISMEIAQKIVQVRPKFVGVTKEFDLDIEKFLLENDIISFERLINTHLLPKRFSFFWVPLKIRTGDGSPVRAYALVP